VKAIRADITGKYFTDEQTEEVIKKVYDTTGYILDPHTAVAYLGLRAYMNENSTKDVTGIFLSTAHPAKFIEVVNDVIGKNIEIPESLQAAGKLKKVSIPMGNQFAALKAYLLK
jgi:threonine synthase